jgi:hypothetical protein
VPNPPGCSSHPLKDIVHCRERWDQFRVFKSGIFSCPSSSLYLVDRLPIDGRTKQIVRIIVIIIGVLSLLKYLTVF